jgi:glucosamine--fructose-6-phosphate aminotransferase (isomerizing)
MSQMLLEAQEAPQKVRALVNDGRAPFSKLGEELRALDPTCVLTIARGSSDHAANYASYLIPLSTGRVVSSLPPSVVTVLHAQLNCEKLFAVSISQSGGSPDILAATQALKTGGALTATLVNEMSSPLALASHHALGQGAGLEKSLAATKSVLCSLSAIALLIAEWTEDAGLNESLRELPATLDEACRRGMRIDENLLHGMKNAFVLSRALGQSAALETALKLKEVCGIHAEAFSAAEVRHGPREVVDSGYVVIALALDGSGAADIIAAARELFDQGAKVILFCSEKSRVTPEFGHVIILPEVSDSRIAPIVVLQMIYAWLARASVSLGRDPDRPKTLKSKTIITN